MGLRDHIPSTRKGPGRIGIAGRKSEEKVAKSLGARIRPNSGAMAGAKGDMTTDDFLIESKSTVNNSMSLKYQWLGKVSQEALQASRAPALTITFTHEDGRPISYGQWVLIPLEVFKELTSK